MEKSRPYYDHYTTLNRGFQHLFFYCHTTFKIYTTLNNILIKVLNKVLNKILIHVFDFFQNQTCVSISQNIFMCSVVVTHINKLPWELKPRGVFKKLIQINYT